MMLCKVCQGSKNTIKFKRIKIETCFFCGGRGVTDKFIEHAIVICKGFNVVSKDRRSKKKSKENK